MNLRPYQSEAIAKLREAFRYGLRSILLEAPTGAGKTVVFSQIAKNANDKGASVLIITDRLNLNDQTNDKLSGIGANATVMTVQTAIRREVPKYDIIIVDEAHKRTFDNFLKKQRAQHGDDFVILGFTATPLRQGRKNPLRDIYQAIISVTTIRDLINGGYLVPAKHFGAPISLAGIRTVRGDYDPKQLFQSFDDNRLYNNVVQRYQDHAPGTKAIVFCINVEHSQRTAFHFKTAGIRAAHVDSNTPTHFRKQILKDFASGKVEVLCNCDLYTTGFDEPSIETVILNRATRSLTLFLQMCGRGSRPFPGKTGFKIIDMGNNVFTNGFWQQARHYNLDEEHKPAKPGIAPVKDCKGCGAIIPAGATVCEYCGEVQPKRAKEGKKASRFIELDAGILERDIATLTFTELDQYRRLKKYKFGWMVRQVIERGQLEQFASFKGYSSGWLKRTKEYYKV